MALTFNLPSQIVVQTAAQWAADNTVYSAKRILVTSDANWDNTDQRKFKIADGTQTWSQLDYPPIGYETMTTSAGEFKFAKTTAGAVLLWTNGQDMRFSASVGGSPAFILKTDGTIVLENGTANKFLKTGASKEITLVDNPVDVNTIGSAINGATSATPNDTDLVMSVDTSVAKKNTWTQIKAFLKTYFDTVYQATGSYLTSANITQTITNGVTTNAPSEDAVFDALALKADKSNTVLTTYLEIPEQSKPATPTNAFRLYADTSNCLSWIGENGYVRTFDGTANTADRTYTLPNASGKIQLQYEVRNLKALSANLASATTYYLGPLVAAWNVTQNQRRFQFEEVGTVEKVSFNFSINNVPTNEQATLYLRNSTTSTDYTLGNIDFSLCLANYSLMLEFTGLSIPVNNSTDQWTLKLVLATMVTAPVAFFSDVIIYNKIT